MIVTMVGDLHDSSVTQKALLCPVVPKNIIRNFSYSHIILPNHLAYHVFEGGKSTYHL